ncbi:MAG TPA: lysophospholipid acyltransferase family protein [Enhygromyxa sp.]|nr:lysophospholipid acyltransferase family protein [Enhygromyxa sp.]
MPGQLRAKLRVPVRAAGMIGWTSVMLAGVESHKLVDRKLADGHAQEQIFDRYMRTWTAGLLRMFAVDLQIVGRLPPPAAGPRMVISNHRSALDIGVLLTHFGGSVLSRADLQDWPLLGLAARKAQTIFVDRDSKHSGAQAIRAIREQLQRGRTVSVFPEGTTFAGDEVRPFNAGAFVAARKLDVEYVPVGIAYPAGCEFTEASFVEHVAAVAERPRTPAVMAVGEPLRIDGRANQVAERLHGDVQRLVDRARSALERPR